MQRNRILTEILKYVCGIIIGILITIGINSTQKPIDPTVIYTEIHDTIPIEKVRIVNHTVTKYVQQVDTFYLQDTDTILVNNIPIEHKEYNDTLFKDSSNTEIKVQYHGFCAEIDSVSIKHNYQEVKVIEKTPPNKLGLDLTLGPAVGYGWGFGGPTRGTPYVGFSLVLGLSYRITK